MMIIHCETGDVVVVDGDTLVGADRSGKNLHRALLDGQVLQGADLSGAELRSASLEGPKLERANLSRASLAACNASRASFAGAILTNTMMRCGIFVGADFSGANLRGTSVLAKRDPLALARRDPPAHSNYPSPKTPPAAPSAHRPPCRAAYARSEGQESAWSRPEPQGAARPRRGRRARDLARSEHVGTMVGSMGSHRMCSALRLVGARQRQRGASWHLRGEVDAASPSIAREIMKKTTTTAAQGWGQLSRYYHENKPD